MTKGKLAKWLVKEGDSVSSGDLVAEIETDKATMEVEAVDEGQVAKLLVAEGSEGVAVGTVIALIAADGEDPAALDSPPAATKPTATEPAAEPAAAPAQAPATEPAATPATQPIATPAAPPVSTASTRRFASPLARRLASEKGLDLSQIQGSGPHGRIIKRDVEAASAAPTPVARSSAATPANDARALFDALEMAYNYEPASNIRKTIARRLQESKQEVPHFYLTLDTRIDRLLSLRKEINAAENIKVSVNDFVILAAAKALMEVPEANAAWVGEGIARLKHADISVAVATDRGLITPVIRQAERKTLTTISGEMRDLAGRAHAGKLKPQEYQGGSFSISNLGMFGIREFSAVINPPQGAILAVGAGEKRPIVNEKGELEVASMMSVTISCDHRVIDGALGAVWMQAFQRLIENPLTLLV
jgi:pyruvate dehydrogenase E2 component (dihydrolipoamide acetyltransferase)